MVGHEVQYDYMPLTVEQEASSAFIRLRLVRRSGSSLLSQSMLKIFRCDTHETRQTYRVRPHHSQVASSIDHGIDSRLFRVIYGNEVKTLYLLPPHVLPVPSMDKVLTPSNNVRPQYTSDASHSTNAVATQQRVGPCSCGTARQRQ